jgi:hypothetical protein
LDKKGGLTLFWYFRIYRRATVPGLNLCGFLTPETRGADLRAIFWAASCFRGTFWAVDFLAVCFVRAIDECVLGWYLNNYYKKFIKISGLIATTYYIYLCLRLM